MCSCLSEIGCENKLPAYYGLLNFQYFSQEWPTGPYREPDKSGLYHCPYFTEIHFNISLQTT